MLNYMHERIPQASKKMNFQILSFLHHSRRIKFMTQIANDVPLPTKSRLAGVKMFKSSKWANMREKKWSKWNCVVLSQISLQPRWSNSATNGTYDQTLHEMFFFWWRCYAAFPKNYLFVWANIIMQCAVEWEKNYIQASLNKKAKFILSYPLKERL